MKISRRRSASATLPSICYALASNLAVAVWKYLAALRTNSGAVLAEGIYLNAVGNVQPARGDAVEVDLARACCIWSSLLTVCHEIRVNVSVSMDVYTASTV